MKNKAARLSFPWLSVCELSPEVRGANLQQQQELLVSRKCQARLLLSGKLEEERGCESFHKGLQDVSATGFLTVPQQREQKAETSEIMW